jgi:hypothetical protein
MRVRYPVSVRYLPRRTIHPRNRSNLHTPILNEVRMNPDSETDMESEGEDDTPEYPLPSPTNPLNPDLIESTPDGEPDIGTLPDQDREQPDPG